MVWEYYSWVGTLWVLGDICWSLPDQISPHTSPILHVGLISSDYWKIHVEILGISQISGLVFPLS